MNIFLGILIGISMGLIFIFFLEKIKKKTKNT